MGFGTDNNVTRNSQGSRTPSFTGLSNPFTGISNYVSNFSNPWGGQGGSFADRGTASPQWGKVRLSPQQTPTAPTAAPQAAQQNMNPFQPGLSLADIQEVPQLPQGQSPMAQNPVQGGSPTGATPQAMDGNFFGLADGTEKGAEIGADGSNPFGLEQIGQLGQIGAGLFGMYNQHKMMGLAEDQLDMQKTAYNNNASNQQNFNNGVIDAFGSGQQRMNNKLV